MLEFSCCSSQHRKYNVTCYATGRVNGRDYTTAFFKTLFSVTQCSFADLDIYFNSSYLTRSVCVINTCGGRGEVHRGFWWGNLRERDHLEVQDLDWRIILRWIFRKWVGGMDWIVLAQDRDRWRLL